ncbi:cell division protein SepF [Candidatus Micrarchaeota archaeon]|nr:cell division protein SepF [Candidatus Micrarchaeota archaeon]MBU2477252.1 cell division protein SepF [Candidatus Micrarchaeota archaeon]
MAFMDKIFKKQEDSVDIEEFLNNLDVEEETMVEDADAYVKPISLTGAEDTAMVSDELRKGNIILLNIGDLSKRNAIKLRELVSSIKNTVEEINGDIARISNERILVTPSKVKIIKRKE